MPVFVSKFPYPLYKDTPAANLGNLVAHYEECPICGKSNFPENTFRCKSCKRPFICLQHQNPQTYLCTECENTKKSMSLDNLRLEAFRNLQDSKKVLQFCESLYYQALSSYNLKRWSYARKDLKEIIQLIPEFKDCEQLLNDTYIQEAMQQIRQQNLSSSHSILYEFLRSTSFEKFRSGLQSAHFQTQSVYKSNFVVLNTQNDPFITFEKLMSGLSSRGAVCLITEFEHKLNGDYNYGLIFKTAQLGILITYPYVTTSFSYGQVGELIYG